MKAVYRAHGLSPMLFHFLVLVSAAAIVCPRSLPDSNCGPTP
jgi:hypothetical protein